MFSPMQKIGGQGERWAREELIKQGYRIQLRPFNNPSCDFIVDGLPVEIKYARPTLRSRNNRRYQRWQFHIHKPSHEMQGEWLLVLVAEDQNGNRYPFIVPGSMVNNRSHLQLTSHPKKYRGWMAGFLGQWQIIDYLSQEGWRDQPHFEKWLEGGKGSGGDG